MGSVVGTCVGADDGGVVGVDVGVAVGTGIGTLLGGDVGTIDGWIVGGSDSAAVRPAHQRSASADVRQRGRRRALPGRRRTTGAAAAVRRRARGRTSGASSRAGRAGGPFRGSITTGAASVVIYRLIRMFASLRYRAGRPRAAGSVYAPRFIVIGLYNHFRCASNLRLRCAKFLVEGQDESSFAVGTSRWTGGDGWRGLTAAC